MALATLAESLTCFTAFPAPMAADMKMDVIAMQKTLLPNGLNQIFGGVEVIENKAVTTPIVAVAANIPNAIMLTIGVLLPAKL